MPEGVPDISIVTPSYNMLPFLQRCVASVRDQGVSLEHVVMDGGSSDGTPAWLTGNPDLVGRSEKDKGMYHALNKALALSRAPIVGHLNCDEQYLPGVLRRVIDYFASHPEVDFVAGDFLIVDPSGDFLAYRKAFQPRWFYFFSNYLYTNTCTLFYRRKVIESVSFDESYKSIADVIFVANVIRRGFKGVHLPGYTAAFVYSGANLSLNPVSDAEKKRHGTTLPLWFRLVKPVFFLLYYLEKWIHGNYREGANLSYALFTEDSPQARRVFRVARPTFRIRFVRKA